MPCAPAGLRESRAHRTLVHQLILLPGHTRSEPFGKPPLSWLRNNPCTIWSRLASAGVGMSLVSCTRRRRSNFIPGRVMHQHLRPLNVNAIHLIPLRQHRRGQGCGEKNSLRISFKFNFLMRLHSHASLLQRYIYHLANY